MREEVREFLRRAAADSDRRAGFFDGAPDAEDDIADAVLDANIAAVERLDPSQAASSLLIVRLSGEGVVDGWIEQSMQDAILGPLTKEVELAAPSNARADVRLGLVGISTGSVLLHYRPLVPARPPGAEQLAYATHPADTAVQRVSELHDFLEAEADPAVISSAFKDDQDVLRQARKLVEALDKHSVNLSTRWWGSRSDRHKSTITERGREHGLRIFAAKERDTVERIQGMVTGLDIDGLVTVTQGTNRKYKVDVGADLVKDAEFQLGERVFLLARKLVEVDEVGVSQSYARYKFVRHLDQPSLDVWE